MRASTKTYPVSGTLLAAVLLAGCAVGPDYKTPGLLGMPGSWLGLGQDDKLVQPSTSEQPGTPAYWQAFNDATLSGLVARALEKNGDLRVALAAVDEARGARLSATSLLFPAVNATATGSRGDSTGSGNVTETSGARLDASWEIDLFGGNRRSAEAARAALGGARAQARLAQVRLMAEVTTQYLNVRSLQEQARLTKRNLDDQNETLRIVQARYDEGLANTAELAQARAQTAVTAAQLPQVESSLASTMNGLGVLTGYTPQEIAGVMATAQPVPLASPLVLVDGPANVIGRRPDVRVAERALAQATANQGVALSNWFPRVSLAALFGLASSSGGSSDVWSAGGTVSLPLIDFGTVRGLVRQANARQQQALATYEQTVLAALADVESSLTGYVKAMERVQKLQVAADASRTALEMVQAQYREGLVALLDVLTAQQNAAAADITLAQGKAEAGTALATLYKAIGG